MRKHRAMNDNDDPDICGCPICRIQGRPRQLLVAKELDRNGRDTGRRVQLSAKLTATLFELAGEGCGKN